MSKLRTGVLGLTLTSALVLAAASANAADIYRGEAGGLKDGPGYVPIMSWTGFYAGINGGYAFSGNDKNFDFDYEDGEFAGSRTLDSNGGFGGGQIGYNAQRGNFVFGIEADFQGAGIDGESAATNGEESVNARVDVDWFGTVRGRLGYAFDRTLVYATGGFAFGSVNTAVTFADDDGFTTFKDDGTETGFVIGGGFEHALTPSWSLKAEYQYIDFGSVQVSGANFGDPVSANVDNQFHTVRAGLNYKFNGDYEPLK